MNIETSKPCPFKPGCSYLIRTVTFYAVGRVVEIAGDFIVLEDASWIPSTGRLSVCLAEGSFDEIEPAPCGMYVNMGSIADAFLWTHDLPKEAK